MWGKQNVVLGQKSKLLDLQNWNVKSRIFWGVDVEQPEYDPLSPGNLKFSLMMSVMSTIVVMMMMISAMTMIVIHLANDWKGLKLADCEVISIPAFQVLTEHSWGL